MVFIRLTQKHDAIHFQQHIYYLRREQKSQRIIKETFHTQKTRKTHNNHLQNRL
jgi:hypothetical protein